MSHNELVYRYTKKELRRDIAETQGNKCFYCHHELVFNNRISRRRPTLDHRVPIHRFGGWNLGNLVVACFECNNRKGSLPEQVFRELKLGVK